MTVVTKEEIIETIAPKKTKVSMIKAPLIETVELIGTFNELLGEHTIFHGKHLVSFINGKAEVSIEVAEELRTAGQVK